MFSSLKALLKSGVPNGQAKYNKMAAYIRSITEVEKMPSKNVKTLRVAEEVASIQIYKCYFDIIVRFSCHGLQASRRDDLSMRTPQPPPQASELGHEARRHSKMTNPELTGSDVEPPFGFRVKGSGYNLTLTLVGC